MKTLIKVAGALVLLVLVAMVVASTQAAKIERVR